MKIPNSIFIIFQPRVSRKFLQKISFYAIESMVTLSRLSRLHLPIILIEIVESIFFLSIKVFALVWQSNAKRIEEDRLFTAASNGTLFTLGGRQHKLVWWLWNWLTFGYFDAVNRETSSTQITGRLTYRLAVDDWIILADIRWNSYSIHTRFMYEFHTVNCVRESRIEGCVP